GSSIEKKSRKRLKRRFSDVYIVQFADIRQELDIKPVSEFFVQRQLGWLGHLMRMKDTAQERRVWEAGNKFKRKIRRPKNTWDGEKGKFLKNRGITWKEAERMAA
ncbi:hypothetical protein HHI36_023642, partial [Cryptolaemus montrouzieri]